jgi:hemerythrin-like metal-binding protein
MALMNWDNSFSVGIPSIDNQHMKLIQMINDLHDSMKSGKGQDVLKKILNDMANYTVNHFNTEELLFKKHGYADTESHIMQHRMFIDKVSEVKKEIESGKPVFTLKLMNFLKDWLQNHILKTDMEYKSFLIEKGVK